MRNVSTLFMLAILFISLKPLQAQQRYFDEDQEPHLWGEINLDHLKQAPFGEWFAEQAEAYTPLMEARKRPPSDWENLTVDVFLGTWCGDSKEWVPRFVKLWESQGLDVNQINFIGLHRDEEYYKQGPNKEEAGLNIHRVPTFIFKKGEEEVGRIVERPLNSLETDFVQIANGTPSAPRYRAVSYLHEQFETQTLDSLYANGRTVLNAIWREVSTSSELNTYGYVLKAAGKLDQALFVFKVNSVLFRYNPRTYDSLAEMQFDMEDYEASLANYEKALEMLGGEDEHTSEMIDQVNEQIKAGE